MDPTKTCPRCGESKPRTEFNRNKLKKDGLQPYCRDCQRANDREHYLRSAKRRKSVRQRSQEQTFRLQEYVADYLKTHPCVDCGETDPVVLQFDHVRGEKKFAISVAVIGNQVGLPGLKAEIEKCEVRCGNCHHIKTAQDFNHWILRFVED